MKVAQMKVGEKKKLEGYQPGALVARGSFSGIKEGRDFSVEVVESYSTVVFGRVRKFVLTYPAESDVEEREVAGTNDCPGWRMYKLTSPSGEIRYFRIFMGDGRNLSELTISEVQEWEHFYEKFGDC